MGTVELIVAVVWVIGGSLTLWLRKQIDNHWHNNTLRISENFWFWPVVMLWVLPTFIAIKMGIIVYQTEWED